MKELSGTEERFTVGQIENQIRGAIVTRFTDHVAESKIPFLDFAANLNEFSDALLAPMREELTSFGLALEKFFVHNVSLPPEVEKVLDQRAGMAAIGSNMDDYTKFQVANAVPAAAASGGDGGLAGAGMGAGIGMAFGQALAGSLAGGGGGQGAAPAGGGQAAGSGQTVMVRCTATGCNHLNPETARFCSNCGNKLFAD
jgi:membrane protease subunit (stomatin/prohibitin family)